jgi:hypothetical protein
MKVYKLFGVSFGLGDFEGFIERCEAAMTSQNSMVQDTLKIVAHLEGEAREQTVIAMNAREELKSFRGETVELKRTLKKNRLKLQDMNTKFNKQNNKAVTLELKFAETSLKEAECREALNAMTAEHGKLLRKAKRESNRG